MVKPAAVVIYGIKNCDTMKKARDWLDSQGVAYQFHDYKVAGAPRDLLRRWVGEVEWQSLLNRAGTTFRRLPAVDQKDIDEVKAIELMATQPSMIKRPVLDVEGRLLVGFKPELYERALG